MIDNIIYVDFQLKSFTKEDEELCERLKRIRVSLDKINQVMDKIKKM